MALSREGVWSPDKRSLDDCGVLFIGDSIFRHLSNHIPPGLLNSVPGVGFYSGRKISTLFANFGKYVSHKTHTCVLHVGTNDINSLDTRTPELLIQYETVVAEILKRSPKCQIFASSVLPRAINHRCGRDNPCTRSQYVYKINEIICEFNDRLQDLCSRNANLHFLCHNEFW